MSSPAPAAKKLPVVKLAIVAVIGLAGAVLVLRGVNLREMVEQGLALIRSAGPWIYFSAMAVFPALGAPMMMFTIPAGEAFAAQMGLGGVIAATLAAITVNLMLTYWMARYALRPLLTGLLKKYGYSVPKVTPGNALMITLVVRLTPGTPFPLQGYILGLAEVPFRLFMIVSWLAVLPWAVGAIVLGRGVLNGNFKAVVIGIGVIIVAMAAVHFIRKRYLKREG